MTISTAYSPDSYTATAGQTDFAYTFRILADTDIDVYVNGTLQTLTTDYTVSDVGEATGGTVAFVSGLTLSDAVILQRSTALTQAINLAEGDDFPAETLETALDKLTMIGQEHGYSVGSLNTAVAAAEAAEAGAEDARDAAIVAQGLAEAAQDAAEAAAARGTTPPTLITNAEFKVASRSTVANVGSQITLSDVTAGVCTTANTQSLAIGDLFKFDSGDLNGKYGVVTDLTVNTSFTLSDTSLTDTGAPGTGYEVTVAFVAADAYAFDGHSKTSTLDVHRDQGNDGTYYKGLYGAKLTKGADSAEYYNLSSRTDAAWVKLFAGRTVSMGCWGYSVSAADNVKLQLNDSTATTESAFVAADTLTWVEVTRTLGASITSFTPRILLDGDTADVAYISPVMLSFSSSIGEGNFVPHVGEVIEFEADVASTLSGITGYSTVTKTLNLVAETAGKIGSGVSGVCAYCKANDSGSAATDQYIYIGTTGANGRGYLFHGGGANDIPIYMTAWPPIVNDVVIFGLVASASATLDISALRFSAVRVR